VATLLSECRSALGMLTPSSILLARDAVRASERSVLCTLNARFLQRGDLQDYGVGTGSS
jgi:hypothetical protein